VPAPAKPQRRTGDDGLERKTTPRQVAKSGRRSGLGAVKREGSLWSSGCSNRDEDRVLFDNCVAGYLSDVSERRFELLAKCFRRSFG
jgi:hypothetical protein